MEKDLAATSTQNFTLPAFFRLSLELRHMIYSRVFSYTRKPKFNEVYISEGPARPMQRPIPLYFVNRQIQGEIEALLVRKPLGLIITHEDVCFDSIAETSFSAGLQFRDLSRAPSLCIDIWPPHPDRPVDVFNIWRLMRDVRKQLMRARHLQSLTIRFTENKFASWSYNGKISNTFLPFKAPLSTSGGDDSGWNDLTYIAIMFCRVQATAVQFLIPEVINGSNILKPSRIILSVATCAMTRNVSFPEHWQFLFDYAEKVRYRNRNLRQEQQLRKQGARIVLRRLDWMTSNGQRKLSPTEWTQFIHTWAPYFELLERNEYQGRRHYCWR